MALLTGIVDESGWLGAVAETGEHGVREQEPQEVDRLRVAVVVQRRPLRLAGEPPNRLDGLLQSLTAPTFLTASVAKRRTEGPAEPASASRASSAYRQDYALRRRRIRRQRRVAALALLLLAVAGGSLAYLLSRNSGQVVVVQRQLGRPVVTLTVTTSTAHQAKQRATRALPARHSGALAPRPPIVWRPIPFPASRRQETAGYAQHHYGIDSWQLRDPKVIVEHYTATSSFSSAYNTFAADSPDAELGELPGTCAHFIVDRDGTIYQLVPLGTICRHTVGLNWTAFGIEHVGTSDAGILGNPAELDASLRLTLWLMERYKIRLANVIGHNESLSSPYHHELVAAWRCQTHGDWSRTDMNIYRARLQALARREGVPIGAPAAARPSAC